MVISDHQRSSERADEARLARSDGAKDEDVGRRRLLGDTSLRARGAFGGGGAAVSEALRL